MKKIVPLFFVLNLSGVLAIADSSSMNTEQFEKLVEVFGLAKVCDICRGGARSVVYKGDKMVIDETDCYLANEAVKQAKGSDEKGQNQCLSSSQLSAIKSNAENQHDAKEKDANACSGVAVQSCSDYFPANPSGSASQACSNFFLNTGTYCAWNSSKSQCEAGSGTAAACTPPNPLPLCVGTSSTSCSSYDESECGSLTAKKYYEKDSSTGSYYQCAYQTNGVCSAEGAQCTTTSPACKGTKVSGGCYSLTSSSSCGSTDNPVAFEKSNGNDYQCVWVESDSSKSKGGTCAASSVICTS